MADERALQEALRHQLALLSEQFAQRLEGEFQALGDLADALLQEEMQGVSVPAQLPPLRDRLHKIAGSAGTFGFPQLSEAARRLERQAAQWLEHFDAEPVALQAFAREVHRLHAERLPARPAPPEGPLVARRLAHGQSYRIFILEDDPVVGRNMELTLRNFGYDARHYDRPEAFHRIGKASGSPYTVADELNTKRFTFAAASTSSSATVPDTLLSIYINGCATDSPTAFNPAKWITASMACSRKTVAMAVRSRTSAS